MCHFFILSLIIWFDPGRHQSAISIYNFCINGEEELNSLATHVYFVLSLPNKSMICSSISSCLWLLEQTSYCCKRAIKACNCTENAIMRLLCTLFLLLNGPNENPYSVSDPPKRALSNYMPPSLLKLHDRS